MLDREHRHGEEPLNYPANRHGPSTRGLCYKVRMAIIECVPNVSEGRRPEVVRAIVDAAAATPGVHLLDWSSDTAHNRSVITLAGEAAPLKAAVLALFARSLEAIDLRRHEGEHPRMGAVDVVPFVPIEGVTMADCAHLARETGEAVAAGFGVPVFLYEEAASAPARRNLEDIRRGEFEGLAAKMRQPEWQPDFGPAAPHASGGASAIGARMPLIAYNINLATDRLEVARKIAAAVRFSSGGLRFVKAMGIALEDRGIVQVSMNLTNFEKTPIPRVFELVTREAARYGVLVLESEIVGLVPSAALMAAAQWYLQLDAFTADQVLEHRLRTAGPHV
jgi:glutamate formiminotransferase / 5-formyltetrahydrofolate cyclo-ligase